MPNKNKLFEFLTKLRIDYDEEDDIAEITNKVFEKAEEEGRVVRSRTVKNRKVVIMSKRKRKSKLGSQLLGEDVFEVGRKKNKLKLRLQKIQKNINKIDEPDQHDDNPEEEAYNLDEEDPGEGTSTTRNVAEWAMDHVSCFR